MIIPAEIYGSDMVAPHVWALPSRVEGQLPESLSGDFTLIGWYNAFPTSALSVRLWNLGIGLTVDVENNGGTHRLRVSDGSNGIATDITENLSTDGNSWTCIIVRRLGSTISVFEGKTKLSDTTVSVVDYGKGIDAITKGIEVADLRILSVGASDEAIDYYYNDVTENNGDELQPRW